MQPRWLEGVTLAGNCFLDLQTGTFEANPSLCLVQYLHGTSSSLCCRKLSPTAEAEAEAEAEACELRFGEQAGNRHVGGCRRWYWDKASNVNVKLCNSSGRLALGGNMNIITEESLGPNSYVSVGDFSLLWRFKAHELVVVALSVTILVHPAPASEL